MGRIKTQLIKRVTNNLIKENSGNFTKDFNENKKLVNDAADFPSKKMRNVVAGYVTRIMKKGDF